VDRQAWLAERRAAVTAEYDAEASEYDAHEYPHDAQDRYVARVLETCPPGGVVLDIPCGTGRYFPLVAAAGRRVVGMDQSAGMLEVARAKGIAERLEQVGLQELAVEAAFDAVLTIDAMENVPPEDWPLVLANLQRAARPDGCLYLTVEEGHPRAVEAAYASLVEQGLPAVPGEVITEGSAGYHYYPGRERALAWVADAGLELLDESYEHVEGDWGYRHLLLRRALGPTVAGRTAGR
jgi:SAM-dependent methyltransferase